MTSHFGHAIVAVALVAGTGPAAAQLYYTETRPVVAPLPPLPLDHAQRIIVYRTIFPRAGYSQRIVRERVITTPAGRVVRERVVTEPYYGDYYAYDYAPPEAYASYTFRIGARIPPAIRLAPVPPSLVAEVPVVRPYEYAVVNNRVLLVDPETRVIVADITR